MLLFIVALVLRLWNIDFGLPAIYHQDEPPKAQVIRRVLEGKPQGYFLHPGLLVNHVACVLRLGTGANPAPDDVAVIRAGRQAVAVLAALTVFPLFFLGRRILGTAGALVATALFIFAPLHVIHSRYLKEDIHLVFGVALALAGIVGWRHSPGNGMERRGWFLAAILGTGWAMASKFVGVVMLPFLVGLAWSHGRGRRAKALLVALAVCGPLLIFLLFSPQVILDVESTVRDLSHELAHGINSGRSQDLYVWQWPDLGTWFFVHAIAPGLSWPVALLAIAGGLMGLTRRKTDPDLFLLSSVALAWYVLIELSPLKRGVDVERYALPCLVPLVILAVKAAQRAVDWWAPRRPGAFGLVCALLLVVPLVHSIALTAAIEPDTRELASRWLTENGPQCPFRLGVLNEVYSGAQSPHATAVPIDIFHPDAMKKSAGTVDVVTIESFFTDRYERFPTLSEKKLMSLTWLREEFPHAVVFRKPAMLRAGFHNPIIEIRFRNPVVLPDGDSP